MIVRVYVHYDETGKLETPKEYSGFIKMYANKESYRSHYLLLRDLETNKSMIPPLYDFEQMFINGVENLVYYKGRNKDEYGDKYYQIWAINYYDALSINEQIEQAKSGAKKSFSFDDEDSLKNDLKL